MRKIIPSSFKDAAGSYLPQEPAAEIKIQDVSLDTFLESYLLILQRETHNLLLESATGKLNKESSQCMRDNLKLIMELKKQEKALLDNLTEDELKKLAKKYK